MGPEKTKKQDESDDCNEGGDSAELSKKNCKGAGHKLTDESPRDIDGGADKNNSGREPTTGERRWGHGCGSGGVGGRRVDSRRGNSNGVSNRLKILACYQKT